MPSRFTTITRAGLILLILTLLVPTFTRVYAFTNGQNADSVLGQSDFTSNTPAITASGMYQPHGVAVDPTSGAVFVADTLNARVLRFASTAALLNGAAADGVLGAPDFTSYTPGTTASQMGFVEGVAVDNVGTLWVADYQNSRVLRFDHASTKANGAAADGVLGQSDFTSNTPGITASRMYQPHGVAIDSTDTLWVADTLNARVLRFDRATTKANGAAADGVLGAPDFTSYTPGTTASQMGFVEGVAVDNVGTLWVADYQNSRVLRFDHASTKANGAAADGVLGQSDFTSNTPGITASRMYQPHGVAIDSTDTLWVADTLNARVLRFDRATTKANGAAADGVLGAPDFTSYTPGTTASQMGFVEGVAVDSVGTLWVADYQNSRVLRFDKSVQTITFAALGAKTYGDAPFTVSATGGASGLPVTFTSATPTVCTMSGNTVTLVSGGTCTIVAQQAADGNYRAAEVSQSFTVNKATQMITFETLPAKTVNDAAFDVSATASSGGPVTFTSATPAVCTVTGSTVTLLAPGICTITADQTGDVSYSAAPSVSQSFTVVAVPRMNNVYLPFVRR